MRGGLERWKRGVESQGVRQAIAYAFKGTCDSHLRATTGVEALAGYSRAGFERADRYCCTDGRIEVDQLGAAELRRWVDGHDPATDEPRGRDLRSKTADLILDGTINAPKSYSIAALLNEDLAAEFEALQDRLRTTVITMWQRELNARRGAGGRIREALAHVEVVELRHRRSRALDPHIHRHLWLNVKVLGQDGRWSNIDSRVALRLHTVVNAEGELAARTDTAWIAALARHGFTLNEDGEIAELAAAVRPLSRRSNQIEANRAKLLIEWREAHPGQEPDRDVLTHVDRLAWAQHRPNKPDAVDEDEWEHLIRDELRQIDPELLLPRHEERIRSTSLASLDHDLLAAQAIVDADNRSASCGGRFSEYDIRAGALRALAASRVVADRDDLEAVLQDVIARAHPLTIDLLDAEPARPDHIKALMAQTTALLKLELATHLDDLAIPGSAADVEDVRAAAARALPAGMTLDASQTDAAAAISGTDRLVAVPGPAGTGKTTMLKTARAVLAADGRRMLVVAPTKKAASVAGREIGATASSLHALLADHGWRWTHDDAGGETWTQLHLGDIDPTTAVPYAGATRFPLRPDDRVVVDEAGMVDLHTANALAIVAKQTGAGIAMVGDHLQAMPVGHSGAMATLTQRATRVVELTAVHRFRDPDYAALTLRMREPDTREAAIGVAIELDRKGLIRRAHDQAEARDAMVDSYFRWVGQGKHVALVTSTNEEADAINEDIQQRRLELGQLTQQRIAIGQAEQRLLEGDVVQTRRNDHRTGVENRALWIIHRILPGGIELHALNDSGDLRTVSHDYLGEHVHLAYASTVHGIQGETTEASIVGPGVDASGLYVGMTRGRLHNEVIAIAHTDTAAREQIADSMTRGIPEVNIDDSIRAARSELGRAARTPAAPNPIPRWDDSRRRPFGRVIDLDRFLALMRGQLGTYQAQLGRNGTWIQRAQMLASSLAVGIAAAAAAGHGRRVARTVNGRAQDQLDQLTQGLSTVRSHHGDELAQIEDLEYRIAAIRTELALRASLPLPLLEQEARARHSASTAQTAPSAVDSVSAGLR